jgi:hypothetical protein
MNKENNNNQAGLDYGRIKAKTKPFHRNNA